MKVTEFLELLNSKRFGIVSTSPDRFHKLVYDLVELAQNCDHIGSIIILDGRYNGESEKSVLVENITDTGIWSYGLFEKQESVFHSERGLIFIDGKDDPSRDVPRLRHLDSVQVFSPEEFGPTGRQVPKELRTFDNASAARLHDGTVLFSLGLDTGK